jgi:NADPH:quinone reductase-like Zn-dependent oxidoreductase
MKMRAIVWTKYGKADGLQLREVDKPAPKDNEVLIKIHATTVSAGDVEMRTMKLPLGLGPITRIFVGVIRPKRIKILGQELAGEIVEIGKDVTRFTVGDQVVGGTGFFMGGYAEYICFPEKPDEMDGALAIKPINMSYEEAAAIPLGGLESLHFLRLGNIQPGEHVLVNGAGGSIGTIGIQLAKYYGAEVTAVDSTGKLEMLRSIGADHMIDYTQEDFTKSGKTYDVIFDVIGKSHFSRSLKILNNNGRYLIANPKLPYLIRGPWATRRTNKKVVTQTSTRTSEGLYRLKELIEAGVVRTVIDRRYPLEEMVEAHRYVETGRKKGNVIIKVVDES